MNAVTPIRLPAVAPKPWASPVLCATFHRVNDAYDRLMDGDDRAADLMAAMDAIEEADAALERAGWLEAHRVGSVGRVHHD